MYASMLANYVRLAKPRIMLLVDLVAVAAMFAAGRGRVPLEPLVTVLLAGSLAVGGAGAFNSYLDRDIDSSMPRTRLRPIPTGAISPPIKAVYFGFALSIAALVVSALLVNLLTTVFIGLGIFIYVVIYTSWLKRRHSSNIVLGGAAGSMAALAGWAAVANGIALPAVLLAILVFLWTPSHFWALALRTRDEYSKVRLPMLPSIVDEAKAAGYILLNSVVLVAFSALPFLLGAFGGIYLLTAMSLGGLLLMSNIRLVGEPVGSNAWLAFRLSNIYMAMVLLAIVTEALLA